MKPIIKEFTKSLILVIIFLCILFFIHFSGLHARYLNPDQIRSFVTSFGPLAPLAFIALYALPIFSDSIFALVGGMTFGPFWGTIYSVIGATFSSTFAFFIARYLGRRFVEKIIKQKYSNLDELINKYGFKIILFLRLVPIFPYEGINYGSGLTKIKYRDYILATILGVIPGAFAYNFFGSSLIEATSALIFIPISFVIVLLLFGPTIIKYLQKESGHKLR